MNNIAMISNSIYTCKSISQNNYYTIHFDNNQFEDSSYTLLLYCPLSGSMYRARLSMTVAVTVRRPIPDTRWRRRVGRENRPEGGREGGRGGGGRGERGVVGNTS